jgi:hypothetical protein
MRLGSFSIRRSRPDLDDVVAAYRTWRFEAATVEDAYRTWLCAPAREKRETFSAYRTALDCEERAAQDYARILHHARHRPEIDLMSQIQKLAVEIGST